MPVGTILPYTGDLNKIPHGWFLCDGSNGTPDLREKFLQGSNVPGQFIEAGLPNLRGRIVASDDTWSLPSSDLGVFRRIGSYGSQDGGNSECLVEFNAHNYNAIYKDGCNTVQPPAYTVYYIMRIL